MSWYDTAYRKLFFDFHSAGTTEGLASAFDAERWADRLQAAHAQAVSVITKCGFGYSYYRQGTVRHVHPHLPEGLDMVAEQIAALHARGLKAIGYYHTFGSEPVAREHPEWVRRSAQGVPQGHDICMLSPLLEAHMLPHIEEIVRLYEVDSMFFDGTYAHTPCYCDACRQRWAEASGGQEIPTDPKDPSARAYLAWQLEAFRQIRQAVCDTIHRVRPEVVVSFNWSYAHRMPEVVPEGVGALVADIYPNDQVFNGSYFSRYWNTLGRPFDVMNSAFLQWWGDWGCKPAVSMQQEAATTLANGGRTWIGYQMTQAFDVAPAVMGELGKTLAFVAEREPLLLDAQPIPNVAVLHTTSQHLTQDAPAAWIQETSARGAHKLLLESMIPHQFLNEADLLARLYEYHVVIVPDQRYLPPELVTALEPWVQAGGVLLAAAFSGTLDTQLRPTGRLALEGLLGVRLEGRYDQTHAYVVVTDDRLAEGALDMPHLAEAPFALARPVAEDVQTLARLHKIYLRSDGASLLRWSPVGEDSGYPAITLRRVGQGWAAFLAGDLFHAYMLKNQWTLKAIVANLLRVVQPEPFVQVQAASWVEVAPARQAAASSPSGVERTLIHLINHHGNRAQDGNNYCLETPLPLHDLVVRVRRDTPPRRVSLEPEGLEAVWQFAAGVVTIQVPTLTIHTAIVLE